MINMSPLAITIYEALKSSGAKKSIPFEVTVEDLAEKVDIHVGRYRVDYCCTQRSVSCTGYY